MNLEPVRRRVSGALLAAAGVFVATYTVVGGFGFLWPLAFLSLVPAGVGVANEWHRVAAVGYLGCAILSLLLALLQVAFGAFRPALVGLLVVAAVTAHRARAHLRAYGRALEATAEKE